MGKQAKKRRQAAAASLANAAQAVPPPNAAKAEKPKHTHAPIIDSDALTGVRLDPALPTWYLDGDMSRPEVARQPIPSRIHSSRETRVGNEWAPEFARYMAPVLPRIVAEERQMWLRWWDISYVLGRLRKRLGYMAVEAALACLRDGGETNDVATAFHRSPEWVRRQISLTVNMAATYFQQRPHKHAQRQRDA